MKIVVNTVNDCTQNVTVNFSVIEFLVMHKALKFMIEDKNCLEKDRVVIESMLKGEHEIKEKGES